MVRRTRKQILMQQYINNLIQNLPVYWKKSQYSPSFYFLCFQHRKWMVLVLYASKGNPYNTSNEIFLSKIKYVTMKVIPLVHSSYSIVTSYNEMCISLASTSNETDNKRKMNKKRKRENLGLKVIHYCINGNNSDTFVSSFNDQSRLLFS